MKAIVFAAGLGTRLKPFTLEHPKALVEVNGKPMLQRVVERLRDAGVSSIVVNVHHFASQITDFLHANSFFGCDIAVSDESDLLLDTGGGIAKAAPLLAGDEPFIAYNADILSDFDIGEMIEAHRNSDADVTLLTSGRSSSRRIYFDTTGRLRGWQNLNSGESRPDGFIPDDTMHAASFNGVHIISPKVLPLLTARTESDPVFSIMPFYLGNIDHLIIRSYRPTGSYQWYDIGRNETLADARSSFRE
ncbi:MAG: nucleotidyltransferase family protein [Muribaculaceae bacterium]|nr:nucleotidyltransferase family protein [Muribaculaceae bacterium]